jgi:hypothetical protein
MNNKMLPVYIEMYLCIYVTLISKLIGDVSLSKNIMLKI